MGFFSSTKAKLAASKLAEEQLYAEAASEVASGKIRQGLWAKAIAETDGNDAAAKARYLKLRVETMKAEADVMDYAFEQAREEAHRKNQKAPKREEKHRENQQRSSYEEPLTGPDLTWLIVGMIIILSVPLMLAL